MPRYKLDRQVIAGMLGVTNMGMPMPEASSVAPLLRNSNVDHDEVVTELAARYMECDEHYDIFSEEIRSWVSNLSNMSDDEIEKTYPEHVERYCEAGDSWAK